ncbi:MAG: hypothetical protein GX681_00395 [Clostridiaceae bacterium]|nr:hypothetical protein [Clostridiaceae bacterium]
MGLRSLWEALKIDKAPNVRTNRLAFLLAFVIAAILYITEPLQAPFTEFYNGLQSFLLQEQGFPVPSNELMISLTKQLLLNAVSLYFILFSALNFLEYKGEKSEAVDIVAGGMDLNLTLPRTLRDYSPAKIAWKYYPSMLVLAVAMLGIQIFSIFFFKIPYYIAATMLSMTIFEQIYEERDIFQGMEASASLTKGFKFYIFIQMFILNSVFSLAETVLLNLLASSLWAGSLIRAILFAWLTFAGGRLAGMIYKVTRLLHISLGALNQGRF